MHETLTIDDLEALAQTESIELQHFFIGVEHLFLALLKLKNGITAQLLEQLGQLPEQVLHDINAFIGRGDSQRYWTGARITPRAQRVLTRARMRVMRGTPSEYALLMAILEEGESIAARVLRDSGIDLQAMLESLNRWTLSTQAEAPAVNIECEFEIVGEQREILQMMFRKYARIKVENIFRGGYSSANVLLVRPYHADGRADALTVVKFDDRQSVWWEKKRYDSFVRDTLPPTTARIEAEPILSERLSIGGLRYTFIRSTERTRPVDFAEFARKVEVSEVCSFLREKLYEGYRDTWWGQTRPYHFPAWHECELLLPPALTVDVLRDVPLPPTARILRPMGDWSHGKPPEAGEIVALEGFVTLKTRRNQGILSICAGADPDALSQSSRIEVRGLDVDTNLYFRGESVPRLIVQVARTRDNVLAGRAQDLGAPFDLEKSTIPYSGVPPENAADAPQELPNPLHAYVTLLNKPIMGMLSTIHGDLHTGNILVGFGGDAWLIDFEWSRDGYTLFDWAVLEVSLMLDYVRHVVPPGWEGAWQAVHILDTLNRERWTEPPKSVVQLNPELAQAFRPVAEVRSIVADIIARENPFNIRDTQMIQSTRLTIWSGYFAVLALVALRAASWVNRPLEARRLQFLVSALCAEAALSRGQTDLASQTKSSP